MSRRNSAESIASVASTAASVDSSSGQPKARKSFKPGIAFTIEIKIFSKLCCQPRRHDLINE